MKTPVGVVVLLGAFLSIAAPAMAQSDESGWYAGVGAGRLNADFRPYYTYYSGGTPDQFENKANGLQVEFMVGKRLRSSERWSLSLEASASFNSFKWSLSIPEEPSELEYSLPYGLALSVVPEAHFGRVSVYAGIGGGVGRVHEMKSTPDAQVSRYDYDEVRPTLNLGGGVKIKASGGFDLFAHVGHARYFGVEYDSTRPMTGMLPVVSKVEHVTDKPRATGFTVGIIKRF
jgi:opacity protein-like surface antigen